MNRTARAVSVLAGFTAGYMLGAFESVWLYYTFATAFVVIIAFDGGAEP